MLTGLAWIVGGLVGFWIFISITVFFVNLFSGRTHMRQSIVEAREWKPAAPWPSPPPKRVPEPEPVWDFVEVVGNAELKTSFVISSSLPSGTRLYYIKSVQ